jgi:hypothetical protein
MQEVPHPSVAQHNTVKQFDCCGRGNSEYKYIYFLVQISMQMHRLIHLRATKSGEISDHLSEKLRIHLLRNSGFLEKGL